MKQKIIALIMGAGVLLFGNVGLVAEAASGANMGFGIHQSNASGINGIAGTDKTQDQENQLEKVIKNTINWVLGLLSLIVFILLLWGGFQMVTANGDDKKFGAGMTILKQAAIGLGFIAVSWLLVSMIFRVLSEVAKGK
ncbi:MAG: hypothetical protein HXJ92_00065 [candidate division SR1 bacterium]|nr:hypothetical protein [candidate division SR1 bacterium]